MHNAKRTLRCSNAPIIEYSLIKGTFQDSLATLFNHLPANVRRGQIFNIFTNDWFKILKSRACMRFSWTSYDKFYKLS